MYLFLEALVLSRFISHFGSKINKRGNGRCNKNMLVRICRKNLIARRDVFSGFESDIISPDLEGVQLVIRIPL